MNISRNDKYLKRCLVSFFASICLLSLSFFFHICLSILCLLPRPPCVFIIFLDFLPLGKNASMQREENFFVFLSNSKARLPHALIEGNFWHFFRTQSSQFAKILTNTCSLFVYEASQFFQIKMVI